MKLSVIITTYNSEEWLQKVLIGYTIQTEIDFEIVIADDGSSKATKEVIDSFSTKFKHPIIHVWHEDHGFRKSQILNKAILKTNSDYLLFTDGDCIPRNDFVQTHLKYREEGYFLSGGYFKLPLKVSKAINNEHIIKQNCFCFFTFRFGLILDSKFFWNVNTTTFFISFIKLTFKTIHYCQSIM